jgi:hypothetical protein
MVVAEEKRTSKITDPDLIFAGAGWTSKPGTEQQNRPFPRLRQRQREVSPNPFGMFCFYAVCFYVHQFMAEDFLKKTWGADVTDLLCADCLGCSSLAAVSPGPRR